MNTVEDYVLVGGDKLGWRALALLLRDLLRGRGLPIKSEKDIRGGPHHLLALVKVAVAVAVDKGHQA